jgi:putative oxidoreductase
MDKIAESLCKYSNRLTTVLDWFQAPVALIIRAYLFYVFFWSGLSKLSSWPSTLALFQYEFKVPLLSPAMAAVFGTTCELVLPALVLIGFGARLPALFFFIFNITNVLFYPILLTPEYNCALKDHILWGILIGIILLYGHGKWSLDNFLQKKICKEYQY